MIVILGPTSSGKSALGVRLAKKFNGEIISADSRQVYKGLDLSSGKITKKEMGGIKHYCIDAVTPKTHYTVVQFKKQTARALTEIQAKGKTPFVVGGTAFYIKALTETPTIPEVPANWALRRALEKKSADALFLMLKKLDPRRARTIEQKNKRRLIRAIEIIKTTGKPVPLLKSDFRNYGSRTSILFLGIKIDRKMLEKKITKRLDERLRRGMIQEIKKLHTQGVSWKRLDELGLEPRWVARFLQNKISKTDMRKLLLRDIFRFVKHQYTWWKKEERIHWIRSQKEAETLVKKFI
ncbi:MAG: tRNA (adenosine(37)-N6)-dimethylallyltransferase MiaA [Candidatus Niyogibacteria bacterium CG10_big_fil_rev_8_21_14_0_10_46_36]|uniref:tRNA dimethylallyltransferase n=1 Tax=Candidatus Niyogibacteria bacterium CG10_big_fil_rev_8_21_14_0_10_46_36 TaxID=1974726 RepID=A0A2H0TD18_9BACT|nr:MAG: tRNA (adenosine(37)-N6)-dimethylallyltransferase MiaA [Candidatus Niyogibacteria bacterium CG10_big_fil_rev_8_21_14_0_10_46_36]